ncbi:MAG: TolC family protein [Cytophagaceae bacterium]
MMKLVTITFRTITSLPAAKFFLLAFTLLISLSGGIYAQTQDTLPITLQNAEAQFMKNNLLLIAERFNIDIARANKIQAGLWNNPSVYLEQNIYNPVTKKYFDAGRNGENIAQIQQLFLLAGKRNKRVQLEEINREIAEFQFYELMRTLRFELRNTFFDLYYQQQLITLYNQEISSLARTVQASDTLLNHGNISLKEDLRLKAFLFSLEGERTGLINSIYENQAKLSVLLRDTTRSFLRPVLNVSKIDSLNLASYGLPVLTAKALSSRTDLKLYEADLRYEEKNLAYQRSLAIPDLQLGTVYDRQGNYVRNYTGVSLQMNLPAFNRNQGNIQASRYRIEQNKILVEDYKRRIEAEVYETWMKGSRILNRYQASNRRFIADYSRLMGGVLENYNKKNISILEFIDFYESYKAGVIEMNEIEKRRIMVFELLNYYTGEDLFNY